MPAGERAQERSQPAWRRAPTVPIHAVDSGLGWLAAADRVGFRGSWWLARYRSRGWRARRPRRSAALAAERAAVAGRTVRPVDFPGVLALGRADGARFPG